MEKASRWWNQYGGIATILPQEYSKSLPEADSSEWNTPHISHLSSNEDIFQRNVSFSGKAPVEPAKIQLYKCNKFHNQNTTLLYLWVKRGETVEVKHFTKLTGNCQGLLVWHNMLPSQLMGDELRWVRAYMREIRFLSSYLAIYLTVYLNERSSEKFLEGWTSHTCIKDNQ